MSINRIKSVFQAISNPNNCSWEIMLLKYNYAKQIGMIYFARRIDITPADSLSLFLSDLSQTYVGGNKPKINKYQRLCEYDGTEIGSHIYKVDPTALSIEDEFSSLKEAINEPDAESDLSSTRYNAYAISGRITDDDSATHDVKLITLRSPMTVLKHKFSPDSGAFKKLNGQTLSLVLTVNVLIIDDDIYFLDMNAENLFNLERAYRGMCSSAVDEISNLGIVTDIEQFKQFAEKGHNPRRFLSYRKNKVEYIQNADNLTRISDKFNIKISDGRVDTSDEKNVEKFIKFICDKAMLDPVDETPKEVSSVYEWN